MLVCALFAHLRDSSDETTSLYEPPPAWSTPSATSVPTVPGHTAKLRASVGSTDFTPGTSWTACSRVLSPGSAAVMRSTHGAAVCASTWKHSLIRTARLDTNQNLGIPSTAYAPPQAIQTLARATRLEPTLSARCWSVFSCARDRLARRDGAFAFERERLWLNPTAHPRWVQAPMLTALTHLIGTA